MHTYISRAQPLQAPRPIPKCVRSSVGILESSVGSSVGILPCVVCVFLAKLRFSAAPPEGKHKRATLHYSTLHYITLRYIWLPLGTPPHTPLHDHTTHSITFHITTLHYINIYIYIYIYMYMYMYITLHYITERSTAQRSETQHRTAQHGTAQHGAAHHSTAQRSAPQHRATQRGAAQHIAQQNAPQRTQPRRAIQRGTGPRSTSRHGTAPHRTAQRVNAHHHDAHDNPIRARTTHTLSATACWLVAVLHLAHCTWLGCTWLVHLARHGKGRSCARPSAIGACACGGQGSCAHSHLEACGWPGRQERHQTD